MQRILIVFTLVATFYLAKSQDSTDYTLNNIKRYATHIEASLPKITGNIAGNKMQALVRQTEDLKAYLDSINEEMEYLPDEYYYRLSPLAGSCHTDMEEFEKLVLNNDFPGKDTFLAKAFANLQQQQGAFRKALYSAYQIALQQQPSTGSKQDNEKIAEDNTLIVEPRATEEITAINSSNAVLLEAVDPVAITTSSNTTLLDTIYYSLQQIKLWMDDIEVAMKNNNFGKIGINANSISNASLKISDLTLLLKTDQKQNLFILSTGLKNLSETLRSLTSKGITAQDEMQDCLNKLVIKFGSLSTGISLVQ